MKTLKTVLLIEDNVDDQDFFIEAIKGLNANIYGVASNGKDALDILKSSEDIPDFIFMDINMPEMNGIDCLKELKRDAFLKDIPVVILSGDTNFRELANLFGAIDFLEKSCNIKMMRMQLEELINQDLITNAVLIGETVDA